MFLQFIMNVVVVTLVIREFCKEVTQEQDAEKQTEAASSPQKAKALTEGQGEKPDMESNERTETEDKDTREPLLARLTTEEELGTKEENQSRTQEAGVKIPKGVSSQQEDQGEKPEMESGQQSKPFYELKAALTAMWLPAVVGDKKNLFIAASLSTLISKILMLLVSVILAYFFQEKIHPHPFIFWFRVGKSQDS